MKILVIDDRANEDVYSRNNILKDLERNKSIVYDMVLPVENELSKILSNIDRYDLILVDYMFNTTTSIFKSGGALYSVLRDHTKNTPIYPVSYTHLTLPTIYSV